MKALQLLLALFFCFALASAEEAKPPTKPTVMSIMIGGSDGPSYEITYDGRELRYYVAENFFALKKAMPVVVQPTAEAWESFFAELEKLKVWEWKRHYRNPNVKDGTSWHAHVSYETSEARDLVSSGSNGYPPDFQAFLAAVRKLVGGRKFQ